VRIIRLKETASTNTYVKENSRALDSGDMVTTFAQTAGRGQRGNSWESDAGSNITASMLMRWSNFPANRQFLISQAVSLGIVDFLVGYCGVECSIKWPNDIYYEDRKICGILIEHVVSGSVIEQTIIGMGINLNQREFVSDAPNPVSVWQLNGRETDVRQAEEALYDCLMRRLDLLPAEEEAIAREYRDNLWRGTGIHTFADALENRVYRGRIAEIEHAGYLWIEESAPECGRRHRYAFKEVQFVL